MENLGNNSNVSSIEEDIIRKIELSLVAQREYSKRIVEGEIAREDVSALKEGLNQEVLEYNKLSKLLEGFDNEN